MSTKTRPANLIDDLIGRIDSAITAAKVTAGNKVLDEFVCQYRDEPLFLVLLDPTMHLCRGIFGSYEAALTHLTEVECYLYVREEDKLAAMQAIEAVADNRPNKDQSVIVKFPQQPMGMTEYSIGLVSIEDVVKRAEWKSNDRSNVRRRSLNNFSGW
ncbi:MAG: hypothetical protein AAB669_03115 [Patescibacteria group bacterium]